VNISSGGGVQDFLSSALESFRFGAADSGMVGIAADGACVITHQPLGYGVACFRFVAGQSVATLQISGDLRLQSCRFPQLVLLKNWEREPVCRHF
jgi:hypothetical protein